jgi:cellobiose-specific phosphotransferase system component IIC
MLLGMVALAEPGFSRLLADPLYAALGDGFINYIAFTYIGSIALVIGMGVYDQVTRRRLHPAYVAGALWIFANEITAAFLYYQPWWAAFTRRLIAP